MILTLVFAPSALLASKHRSDRVLRLDTCAPSSSCAVTPAGFASTSTSRHARVQGSERPRGTTQGRTQFAQASIARVVTTAVRSRTCPTSRSIFTPGEALGEHAMPRSKRRSRTAGRAARGAAFFGVAAIR